MKGQAMQWNHGKLQGIDEEAKEHTKCGPPKMIPCVKKLEVPRYGPCYWGPSHKDDMHIWKAPEPENVTIETSEA